MRWEYYTKALQGATDAQNFVDGELINVNSVGADSKQVCLLGIAIHCKAALE